MSELNTQKNYLCGACGAAKPTGSGSGCSSPDQVHGNRSRSNSPTKEELTLTDDELLLLSKDEYAQYMSSFAAAVPPTVEGDAFALALSQLRDATTGLMNSNNLSLEADADADAPLLPISADTDAHKGSSTDVTTDPLFDANKVLSQRNEMITLRLSSLEAILAEKELAIRELRRQNTELASTLHLPRTTGTDDGRGVGEVTGSSTAPPPAAALESSDLLDDRSSAPIASIYSDDYNSTDNVYTELLALNRQLQNQSATQKEKLAVLDVQNRDLRQTVSDLHLIINQLKPVYEAVSSSELVSQGIISCLLTNDHVQRTPMLQNQLLTCDSRDSEAGQTGAIDRDSSWRRMPGSHVSSVVHNLRHDYSQTHYSTSGNNERSNSSCNSSSICHAPNARLDRGTGNGPTTGNEGNRGQLRKSNDSYSGKYILVNGVYLLNER